MPPEFKNIEDFEPKIVDLTVSDDHPEFSVQMPIYNAVDMHGTHFLEIRYKPTSEQGKYSYEFNLSNQLLQLLYESKKSIASLPLMSPDQVPHGFALGKPDNVLVAVKKLNDFHESKAYRDLFKKYGK